MHPQLPLQLEWLDERRLGGCPPLLFGNAQHSALTLFGLGTVFLKVERERPSLKINGYT